MNITEKPKLATKDPPKEIPVKVIENNPKIIEAIDSTDETLLNLAKVIKVGDDLEPMQFPSNRMRAEHSKLAIMYSDLNDMIFASHREPGLAKMKASEIQNLRTSIRNYEIVHGITRKDHLRWSGF